MEAIKPGSQRRPTRSAIRRAMDEDHRRALPDLLNANRGAGSLQFDKPLRWMRTH
jgi:hypothetical protein